MKRPKHQTPRLPNRPRTGAKVYTDHAGVHTSKSALTGKLLDTYGVEPGCVLAECFERAAEKGGVSIAEIKEIMAGKNKAGKEITNFRRIMRCLKLGHSRKTGFRGYHWAYFNDGRRIKIGPPIPIDEDLTPILWGQMASAVQAELEVAGGYESNVQIRHAVERRAMDVAKNHYVRDGYQVQDKSDTESYDLLCEKGGIQLLVEVKGTRTNGRKIVLTANEVRLAGCPDVGMELCVVHSIKVSNDAKPEGRGGTLDLYKNWNPKNHELQAVAYVCRLAHALVEKP